MNQILIGKGEQPVHLLAKYGNRHGLVAGATGTDKTISLMVLAEGFSRLGVPVFMADVKGDVAGLAMAGITNEKIQQRVAQIGIEGYTNEANPVLFWDLHGRAGHPVRTTISEIGPTLLGRILELNDIQTGILEIAIKLADDQGMLLLDLDDLRALLGFVADNRKEISTKYGLVSTQSVAAIQRAILSLEREGGEAFLGEPALELGDLMRTDLSGRGIINILVANQLILKPRLYSSFLLWLLSELFENLPEVGDLEKPKLAFFFDESHLLFDDAPPMLRQRVEQVVRIIRSKGVGGILLFAISRRCAERDPRPTRKPHPTRLARLHSARPEGVTDRRGNVRSKPQARRRRGHIPACCWRGSGFHSPGKGCADAGRAHANLSPALPDGGDYAGRARDGAGTQPARQQVRRASEPRVGLRDPEPADLREGSSRVGGKSS